MSKNWPFRFRKKAVSSQPTVDKSELVSKQEEKAGGTSPPASKAAKPIFNLAQTLAHKDVYLSQINIFCDLSPQQMHHMAETTTMITCEKGRVFFQPGQINEVIFLLKRGRVSLYRLSSQGKKIVVATVETGGIFGEMSLMGQRLSDIYAEATEDCLICVMSRSDMERLLKAHPQVALRLLQTMGERVNHLERRLEEMAFKKLSARVASLLLSLSATPTSPLSEANRPGSSEGLITGMSQQELAEQLGASREMVSLVLSEIKKNGVIEIGHKKIIICDRPGLEKMADVE